MLKLVANDNPAAGTAPVACLFKLDQPATFRGIVIHFGGLAHATVAQAFNEFGRLKYRKRGQSIIDADLQALFAYTKNRGGFPHYTVAAAAIIDVLLYIPRHSGRIGNKPDNVESVLKEDNAELEITFGTFANAPQTFYTNVYLDLCTGVQSYDLTFHQLAEANQAASALLTKVYNEENIVSVMIADIASGLLTTVAGNLFATTWAAQGRLDFTIGAMAANANMRGWQAWSDIMNQIETVQVAPCMTEIYNTIADSINMKLQNQIAVNISNGSGGTADPRILLVGMKLNPFKLAETQAIEKTLFNQALAQKNLSGHIQATKVLTAGTVLGA